MQWERPNALGKSVEVNATNRPVKIAYLVPLENVAQAHQILDAIFYEAYTRWGGVFTLVVPTNSDAFMDPGFRDWLQLYDADFIYSFADLRPDFVDSIDRLCGPIAMLKHKVHGEADSWRAFLQAWEHWFKPVASVTTVQSPASYPQHPHEQRPQEPIVLTQYGLNDPTRFITDNFGVAFDIHGSTNPIQGLFQTLCLVPEGLPASHKVGSERCTTVLDAFRAVAARKATPIARFAMANSIGMPRVESKAWTNAFRLIVGSDVLDRINAWNCRHLANAWNTAIGSLIVSKDMLHDDAFVAELGRFFNQNNFLGGSGGGPYHVALHSSSVPTDELKELRDRLASKTHNSVSINASPDAIALPTAKELSDRFHSVSADSFTLRLTEDYQEFVAAEPAHIGYLPPQLRGLARGQWVVECSIQRHNNLSQYSNVIDTWQLPHRLKGVRAFTKRLAKASRDGRLALIPAPKGFPQRGNSIKEPHLFDLQLPSDDSYFRHLVLDFFRYSKDDLRSALPPTGYRDLRVSDKGQNLRGVISLAGDLSTAFQILTKKYWRTVLAAAREDSAKPLIFSMGKLAGLLPNSREFIQELTVREHFPSDRDTRKYLKNGLLDALEHLVRSGVFYQIAQWRCGYCGHSNTRSFDNMKLRNSCDICKTEYLTDIDLEWEYELSSFVHRSLEKHRGLPVLWTLGYLQDRGHSMAFWFMPEVDLFESDETSGERNEIDILCVLGGTFYAIEVKSSASLFLNKADAVDKFVKVIRTLRPDVAMLSFEKYCLEPDAVEETKARLTAVAATVREQLSGDTKLEIVVAEDIDEFREFGVDLGFHGPRLRRT